MFPLLKGKTLRLYEFLVSEALPHYAASVKYFKHELSIVQYPESLRYTQIMGDFLYALYFSPREGPLKHICVTCGGMFIHTQNSYQRLEHISTTGIISITDNKTLELL